jgi:hypothetical protein
VDTAHEVLFETPDALEDGSLDFSLFCHRDVQPVPRGGRSLVRA